MSLEVRYWATGISSTMSPNTPRKDHMHMTCPLRSVMTPMGESVVFGSLNRLSGV